MGSERNIVNRAVLKTSCSIAKKAMKRDKVLILDEIGNMMMIVKQMKGGKNYVK